MSNYNRLRWGCRRGMLELDMFLLPFFDDCYQQLTPAEQQDFATMLSEPDPVLHSWLTLQAEPEQIAYAALVAKIRDYHVQL